LGWGTTNPPAMDTPLIDFRGNRFWSLVSIQGTPSLMELYALCKLYEPIKYGRKPSLSGVIELPKGDEQGVLCRGGGDPESS